MSSPTKIPSAAIDKCFIPYAPDSPPSLYGTPIEASLPKEGSETPCISLSQPLITKAVTAISAIFASQAMVKPASESEPPSRVPAIAMCSPEVNSCAIVDAAVRHIAHRLEADVVVLDPADLAAGEHGVFGSDLTSAFWELYDYQQREARPETPSSPPSSPSPSVLPAPDAPGDAPSDPPPSENPAPPPESDSNSALTRAQDLVKEFFSMNSGAGTRRIIYLRDYTTLSKGLSPLLPYIHSAFSGTPTVVLAGFSLIRRLNGDDSGHFLRYFTHSDGDIIQRLHSRHDATWRRPYSGERWGSLEELFTATFVNRFQRRAIGSRRSDPVRLRDKAMELRFERVIRVGVSQDVPSVVRDQTQKELRARFIRANLQRLVEESAFSGKELCYTESDLNEQADFPKEFHSSFLSTERLKNIAGFVNSPVGLKDLFTALHDAEVESNTLDTEWTRLMSAADTQFHLEVRVEEAEKKSDQAQAVVDPIVARVKGESLDKYERELLGCIVDPTTISTSFDDVCVAPELIDTLRMAVSHPLLFPDAYSTGILAEESLGGVLLFGPPGTGKTLACRAVAKECGARMLQLQSSHLQNCYVGETEKMIAGAFRLARRLGPCVMFIDEIEGLFSKRDDNSKPWHRAMVTEFTQEMDGLRTARANLKAGLIVIGATNRPQDLDSAVVRRLSRRILVDLPNPDQRRAIISRYLRDENVDPAINIDTLSSKTMLFSGSDLRHLVHCAAMTALKEITPNTWRIQYGADGALIPSTEPLPARVIQPKHFDTALSQISASSAANQRELEELRRWDKQLYRSGYLSSLSYRG